MIRNPRKSDVPIPGCDSHLGQPHSHDIRKTPFKGRLGSSIGNEITRVVRGFQTPSGRVFCCYIFISR